MGLDDRQLFRGVREILNRHDLEGLLVLGCPDNEYDVEVEQILPQLAAARAAADVAAIVQKVFMEMFNESPSTAAVAAAADEIWLLYQGAAERHLPDDISLMLVQKDVAGIVFRLGMPRLLLAGCSSMASRSTFSSGSFGRSMPPSLPTGSSALSCKRKRRSTSGAAARG